MPYCIFYDWRVYVNVVPKERTDGWWVNGGLCTLSKYQPNNNTTNFSLPKCKKSHHITRPWQGACMIDWGNVVESVLMLLGLLSRYNVQNVYLCTYVPVVQTRFFRVDVPTRVVNSMLYQACSTRSVRPSDSSYVRRPFSREATHATTEYYSNKSRTTPFHQKTKKWTLKDGRSWSCHLLFLIEMKIFLRNSSYFWKRLSAGPFSEWSM